MTTTYSAYDHTLDLSMLQLSPDTISAIATNPTLVYLLGNGFKQSIGDAGAVSDKDVPFTPDPDLSEEENAEAFLEAKESFIAQRRKDRFEKILSGTVSFGGSRGPRLAGLDKFLFDATTVKLKAAYAKAKKSWPTGKGSASAIKLAVEEYWSKPRASHDEVKRAAQQAFDASRATDSDDLSDILD